MVTLVVALKFHFRERRLTRELQEKEKRILELEDELRDKDDDARQLKEALMDSKMK